jgi:predicted DNA-binding WGR domain protein
MDIDALRPNFTYLLLERVNRDKNELRFYYVAWQPSLFAEGAVVRIYGRKDGQRRILAPLPYPSLEEAWPLIRTIIRLRLRHGYRIVEPQMSAQLCHQGGQQGAEVKLRINPTTTLIC